MDDEQNEITNCQRNNAQSARKKIRIKIDPEIKALVPRFLENTAKKLGKISAALEQKDWETVRLLGHQLKGVGGAYGFDGITNYGKDLELAAKAANAGAVQTALEGLSAYLARVEIFV